MYLLCLQMHHIHSQAAKLWFFRTCRNYEDACSDPGSPVTRRTCRNDEDAYFCTCRNYEDAYSDPGSPVTRRTPQGSFVLAMVDDQKKLLMQGE